MFWNGDYNFFDYKYHIANYSGQDFDGPARTFYLVFSVVTILILLILLRNNKRKTVERYLFLTAIILPIFDLCKVFWESYWDVATGRGLNLGGLLPIYTCYLFIYCMLIAAFSKGKVRDYCLKCIAVFGFVGGISNVIFLNGLKWYPFFTFGALNSEVWHYVMVFTALYIIVTGYVRFEWRDGIRAMVVLLLFSCLVIPIDYIFGWDYMQYYEAGGVPIVEGISETFAENGMRWLTVPVMILAYALCDLLMTSLYVGYNRLRYGKKEKISA